ncbi:putative membrane protein [Helicobacter pylori Hp P-28b]|nr:putative membrane protein [Helicobacter pylori Hp P-28b]
MSITSGMVLITFMAYSLASVSLAPYFILLGYPTLYHAR